MFCKTRYFILKKNIKKIILTGPESTGKTTLAQQLAEHFQTVWVPEFARMYIDDLERPYKQEDLLAIAKGQLEMENYLLQYANDYIFCDTSFLVLKVWSEYKYGNCDPWILKQLESRWYDCYFLCDIDIPWEFDSQRENPKERVLLFKKYEEELLFYQKKYFRIKGTKKERLSNVFSILENLKLEEK